MFTVTKTYQDLPAAHRQPTHAGHCRLIHGHNWRFDITFSCSKLDANGFVVDVGELGWVRAFLVDHFDHTLLLNEDDKDIPPGWEIENWIGIFAKIIRVSNCGMEGLAEFVFKALNAAIFKDLKAEWGVRTLEIIEVTCWEDSKNRATFRL